MSEEVYGIIKVRRFRLGWVEENMVFTSNRVIVARIGDVPIPPSWGGPISSINLLFVGLEALDSIVKTDQIEKRQKEHAKLSIESILKKDKHNYAIPNSEIIKVELGKSGYYRGPKLVIKTGKKKPVWNGMIMGLIPEKKKPFFSLQFRVVDQDEFSMIENILRLAFGDKLSVKK